MVPVEGQLIARLGAWQTALLVLAADGSDHRAAGFSGWREPRHETTAHVPPQPEPSWRAVREALRLSQFSLLLTGRLFSSAVFQVVFIGVHMPVANLRDKGLSPESRPAMRLGADRALSMFFGTYVAELAGRAGLRQAQAAGDDLPQPGGGGSRSIPDRGRSRPLTVYVVSRSVMGFLWLSTVPLTSGLVAQIFGRRPSFPCWGGIVFLSPPGSDRSWGVWLGGYLYDRNRQLRRGLVHRDPRPGRRRAALIKPCR